MTKQNQYFPESVLHPSVSLSEKLEELGMGPKEFAVRTGKPEKTITAILKGESSITPDMAVQFENALQIPARFWLNKQRQYDEYIAREKHKEAIKESQEWAKKFPIAELVKKNWLPPLTRIEEKTEALLKFFGFSSHSGWEDYYCNQQLKVNFRISLFHTKQPHAISAWLRKGDIQASELVVENYNEKIFKQVLSDIKNLMVKDSPNIFATLQTLCLTAGVKVVHTPTLPGAPICGSTRWLNDIPLIQLSGRYQRYDIFWFTFFHEAGHILLHGKKDIFLEEVDYEGKDDHKEKEANDFAIKWIFSKEEEEEMIQQQFQIDEDDVITFAKKYNTHPSIIWGRLIHNKYKFPTFGKQFNQPFILENN